MDRSYQLVVVAASRDPVASDTASKVAPDMTFTEALPTDALFVVGGGLASVRAAEDAALLDYVRAAASSARASRFDRNEVADPGICWPALRETGHGQLGLPGNTGVLR
jgi:hypothetical protein